jgi:DNA-nicking Smr family endonuclease
MKKIKLPEAPKLPARSISDFEAAVFAAELGTAERIDLHGMTREDTVSELDKFLNHQFMEKTEVVKIIHGRGDQILKRAVEQYLKRCPFIEYFRNSNNPNESGGVTYAVIAKKD